MPTPKIPGMKRGKDFLDVIDEEGFTFSTNLAIGAHIILVGLACGLALVSFALPPALLVWVLM